MGQLSYEDFKDKLSIQDVLVDAGYTLNKRDGLRYPSYVRLDSTGRRIRGDKFVVTGNGKCCFQPPVMKNYNIISFIKEHPNMFSDYTPGMSPDRLVNLVCCRLLNESPEEKQENAVISQPEHVKPFSLDDYTIMKYSGSHEDVKAFYPFFKSRGISVPTQKAFKSYFCKATKEVDNGMIYNNLSFPLTIPGKEGVVGFEERGMMRQNGQSYKGKAAGSNSSEGLWIASPNDTELSKASHVYWFESAYDAMAYYQIHVKGNEDLGKAMFLSTGGNPTPLQFRGVIVAAPHATHHLCFDNDLAGKQFVMNFHGVANMVKPYHEAALTYLNTPGSAEVDDKKSEALSYLPESAKQQYFKTWRLVEELATAYLCEDDKKELRKQIDQGWKDLRDMLEDCIVKSEREVPKEGYKDWNDELLDKKQYSLTDTIEIVFDDNGNDIVIEEELEHEDKQTHHHR